MKRAITLAALLTAPAAAQDLTPTEADLLPRVLSRVSADILPDTEGWETAFLLHDAGSAMADLIVLDGDTGTPLMVKRGLVYSGEMGGQSPELTVLPNGSLSIVSQQIGIGRTPWEQTLTLAWRDGALRVAGFGYLSYDRLTTASARCDVNLLTGGWESTHAAEGQPERPLSGRIAPEAPAVADWDDTALPAPCEDALRAAGLF